MANRIGVFLDPEDRALLDRIRKLLTDPETGREPTNKEVVKKALLRVEASETSEKKSS